MTLPHIPFDPGRGRSGLLIVLVSRLSWSRDSLSSPPSRSGRLPRHEPNPSLRSPAHRRSTPKFRDTLSQTSARRSATLATRPASIATGRSATSSTRHPMGRSMALAGADSSKTGTFDAVNLHYESPFRDGRLIHRESGNAARHRLSWQRKPRRSST